MKKLFDIGTVCNISMLIIGGICLWCCLLFMAGVAGAEEFTEKEKARFFPFSVDFLDHLKINKNPCYWEQLKDRIKTLEDRVKVLEDNQIDWGSGVSPLKNWQDIKIWQDNYRIIKGILCQ